jgi:hypothetical protein
MAISFVSRELSILAYANGFTLWHYRTHDAPTALLTRETGDPDYIGYFAPACDLLRRGDLILVSLEGEAGPDVTQLVVTEAAPCGFVTVRRTGTALPAPVPGPDAAPPEIAAICAA